MSSYDDALALVRRYAGAAEEIDRVAVSRSGEVQFCVSPATWWGFRDGAAAHHYAFADPALPLSHWARERNFAPASVLSYRPGRRLVLLDRAERRILKGYRAGHSEAARDRHLCAAAAAHGAAFRVPALREDLSEVSAISFVIAPGGVYSTAIAELDDRVQLRHKLLAWQRGTPEALVARVGSSTQPFRPSNWDADSELDVLDRWCAKLRSVGLAETATWRTLFRQLTAAAKACTNTVLVHRDLHGGQILSAEGQLHVLDFDQLTLGDPAVDPGNIWAHELLHRLQHNQTAGSDWCAANNDELWLDAPLAGSGSRDRVRWYVASTLLRLALVYAIRPRWRHLTDPLLATADYQLRALGCPGLGAGAPEMGGLA